MLEVTDIDNNSKIMEKKEKMININLINSA